MKKWKEIRDNYSSNTNMVDQISFEVFLHQAYTAAHGALNKGEYDNKGENVV